MFRRTRLTRSLSDPSRLLCRPVLAALNGLVAWLAVGLVVAAHAQDQPRCRNDFDGDGVCDRTDNCPTIPNPGQGDGFTPQQIISGFELDVAFVGDLDGDGSLDILHDGWIDDEDDIENSILVWNRNSHGVFEAGEELLRSRSELIAWPFATDLDNDGDIDVGWSNGKVRWLANLADGRADGRFDVRKTLIDVRNYGAWPADIDGDGDDYLVIRLASQTVWYENEGDGVFERWHPIGPYGVKLLIFDPDVDGDLDVVLEWTVRGVQAILGFENNGEGGFRRRGSVVTTRYWPSQMVAGDVDGDGDPDLLMLYHALGPGPPSVEWRPNRGGWRFGRARTIAEDRDLRRIVAADVDGDGDLDVAVARYLEGNPEEGEVDVGALDLYRNLGDGEFAPAVQLSPLPTRWVTAADLQGDERPELVATFVTSASWFRWYCF